MGSPLKLTSPTRNRRSLLCSPLSSHRKNRPGAHVGVGTSTGQAGWDPQQGWEPPLPDCYAQGLGRGGCQGEGRPAGGPGRAVALCLPSEQSKAERAGGSRVSTSKSPPGPSTRVGLAPTIPKGPGRRRGGGAPKDKSGERSSRALPVKKLPDHSGYMNRPGHGWS